VAVWPGGWGQSTRRSAVFRAVLVLGLLAALARDLGPGQAAPAAAPVTLPIGSITAGGATWELINKDIFCSLPPADAFNVDDATHLASNRGDAYDNAFCMFVGSSPYLGPDTVDRTTTSSAITVTSGPTTMSGLNVTYQFAFLTSAPIIGVLASFQNPTGAPITVPITFESNVGSNGQTTVNGSSSGDLTVSAADRWAITSDRSTDPPVDPPIIHVVAGPGAQALPPTIFRAASNLVGPGCATNAGNIGASACSST
jgi:hypothetical protein